MWDNSCFRLRHLTYTCSTAAYISFPPAVTYIRGMPLTFEEISMTRASCSASCLSQQPKQGFTTGSVPWPVLLPQAGKWGGREEWWQTHQRLTFSVCLLRSRPRGIQVCTCSGRRSPRRGYPAGTAGPGAWRWPPREAHHTPACSRLRGATRDRPPGRSATGSFLAPREKQRVWVQNSSC